MDQNRKKYVGWEFISRLSETSSSDRFDLDLEEFKKSPIGYRRDVADGLLCIGVDRSEQPFKRSFAIATFASLVRSCELNKDEFFDQLSDLVENPGSPTAQLSNKSEDFSIRVQKIQEAALIALVAIDRFAGLRKFDLFVSKQSDSAFICRLREIRQRLVGE